MYKRVENSIELTMFNFIWMTAWREKGFEFEFSGEVLDRYLVITEDGQYAGSAEFKRYKPGESEIDQIAPFYLHPTLNSPFTNVLEVDKVALLPEFRGKYIGDLLSSIVYFATRNGYDYLISLLEPVFFRALKITFHFPIEKFGDKIFYKGDYVQPAIIDVDKLMRKRDKLVWLNLGEGLVLK